MSVRKLKPITPGQRFKVVNGFDAITTDKPEKSLLEPLKKSGGRNSNGKMTMRYKGGGHKRRYRVIDFKRDKRDVPAEVMSIEYDPNRSAFIALVAYKDGETTYLNITLGPEASISPDVLPSDLSIYDCIHITPLLDAERQLAFLRACRQRGANRISVGTYIDIFINKSDVVREIMNLSDYFFMNADEAIGLFGSLEKTKTQPGKVLFVTKGKE